MTGGTPISGTLRRATGVTRDTRLRVHKVHVECKDRLVMMICDSMNIHSYTTYMTVLTLFITFVSQVHPPNARKLSNEDFEVPKF